MSFLAVLGAMNALGSFNQKANEPPTASASQDGTVSGHSARSNLVWPKSPFNPYA